LRRSRDDIATLRLEVSQPVRGMPRAARTPHRGDPAAAPRRNAGSSGKLDPFVGRWPTRRRWRGVALPVDPPDGARLRRARRPHHRRGGDRRDGVWGSYLQAGIVDVTVTALLFPGGVRARTSSSAGCTRTKSRRSSSWGTGRWRSSTIPCAKAVSHDGWITVTGGATGTGNGTVTVKVAANTDGARTGTADRRG